MLMPAKTSTTPEQDGKVAAMVFADVYPHYVNKVERKGQTEDALRDALCWLLGTDEAGLQAALDERLTFEALSERADQPHVADDIKGVVCGYRVEAQKSVTRNVRRMD